MKKRVLLLFVFIQINLLSAQSVGDTIVIPAFNYHSATRDTIISFPNNPSLTFEKIILKYNMRCKEGLVSTAADRNLGCGEWDYSCNTFIADSSKVEKVASVQKDYVVSNYTGTSYDYTLQQTYNHYDFNQKNVVVTSSNAVELYTIGSNNLAISNLVKTNLKTGRSQFLVKASDLSASGMVAGLLHAITLNVTNSGGLASFFKVQMKGSNLATLQAKDIDFTGMTEVYFRDYTFVNGSNTIQFHTPFNWDGTSNIIIDISFSNTTTAANIEFQGYNSAEKRTVTASNIYSGDLSYSGLVELNNQFLNTINNQISVSFWAKGDPDFMPSSNSILYGSSDNDINKRQLNLHLPWGNDIYFDCGNVSNSYDRIQKSYTSLNEIEGVWNHWTFTKNATTGSMNIYLNGVLWHSGTGKTKVISIMNLILGKIPVEANSDYKGKIKELTIWNSELAAQTIIDWKNKTIDATHPNYTSLVAYYKFDEANGQVITDTKNNITSTGENLKWDYERGDQLTTTFTESTLVPKIIFHKGNYNIAVTDVVVRYSHPKIARTVRHYSITSNEGIIPMAHDNVNLLSTNNYFDATPENVYDGDTGTVISTIPVTSQGTITITDLNYFKRYPFYNELVSFVTPYGIGLDLGMNGKNWYFDMSDYVKILKGDKRLVMSGGVWQEQLDLDFLFIVGTPPRNVVQFDQLWQGEYRLGSPNISEIINGTKLPTNNYLFSPDATTFKMKSSITGHGSQGEFSQNGGTISHRIFVNNVQKLNWTITQVCSENPIFPQGGTWVYNRQGWCPGQRTLLKEQDLTPHVTPGGTYALDYKTSNPGVANGDYRYIVAHQIVGYGPANFTLDAAIINIKQPNNTNAEYSRVNPMCEKPKITVKNTGSTVLTAIDFEYWLNAAGTHQTYTWTGTLASMAEIDVVLPLNALWTNGIEPVNNKFNVKIVTINGGADQYLNNNKMVSPFTLPTVMPSVFKLSLRTNNSPIQNNYTLYDAEGTVVDTRTFTVANTIHTYTYQSPQIASGCYRLRVNDSGKDGLQWWANTAQGTGYMRVLDVNNNVIKTFNPDFGGGFDFSFSVDSLLSQEIFLADDDVKVYPNPSNGLFSVESEKLIGAKITISDILGNTIKVIDSDTTIKDFNLSNLSSGVYFIKIVKEKQTYVKKLIID